MKRSLLFVLLGTICVRARAQTDPLSAAQPAAQEQIQQAQTAGMAMSRPPQAPSWSGKPLLTGDEYLASVQAQGGTDFDKIQRNFAALAALIRDAVGRMQIAEPRLLVDATANSRYAAGMAVASPNKTGSVYFMIVDGRKLTSVLASDHDLDWFKVIVCHEMDHIKRGDVTLAERAVPSDPDRIESQEVRADIDGGYYSGDPRAMIDYFKAALISDTAKFKGVAPEAPAFKPFDPKHPTAEQIRAVSAWRKEQDPLHAEPLERFFIFEALTKMMGEGSAGGVDGLSNKNGPLRKAVAKEMEDKTLPAWGDLP